MDQSPPAFSIGKEKRLSLNKKDLDFLNVGPGSYTPTSATIKTASPMFTMGKKLQTGASISKPNLITPEPGRYTPKFEHLAEKVNAPAYKIGKAKRPILYNKSQAELVPGPDSYKLKSQIFDRPPRFYIGKLLNHDDTQKFKQSVPGPGAHDVNKMPI